jgi:hypothetical protein
VQYLCRSKHCVGSSTWVICTCLAKFTLGVQPLNLAEGAPVWQPVYQAHPALVSTELGRGPGWISYEDNQPFYIAKLNPTSISTI